MRTDLVSNFGSSYAYFQINFSWLKWPVAMGAALATENCENCCRVVTRMASSEMQEKVVGMRACAKEASDPPEVWVEILEMVFREDGHVSFDPRKFSLTGLKVKTRVEITGTKAQIVKEVSCACLVESEARSSKFKSKVKSQFQRRILLRK